MYIIAYSTQIYGAYDRSEIFSHIPVCPKPVLTSRTCDRGRGNLGSLQELEQLVTLPMLVILRAKTSNEQRHIIWGPNIQKPYVSPVYHLDESTGGLMPYLNEFSAEKENMLPTLSKCISFDFPSDDT